MISQKNYHKVNIILILVVGSIISWGSLPAGISIGLVGLLYGCTLIMYAQNRTKNHIVRIPLMIFIPLVSIILLHIINIGFFRVQNVTNIMPPILMVGVFLINLILIPNNVSKKIFFYSISRYAFIIALIPLLAFPFIGQFEFISEYLFRGGAGARKYGFYIDRPTSLAHNPNNLSKLLFVGAISTIGVHRIRPERTNYIIFATIVIILLLTQSRGSTVALFYALAVYLFYIIYGKNVIVNLIFVVLVTFIFIFFPYISVILLSGPDLTGRVYLWEATIVSIQQGPITGQGFGTGQTYIEEFLSDQANPNTPHNAFLYTSLRLGIIGGLSYIVLIIYPILSNIKGKSFDIILVSLGLGFVLIQTIDGVSALFLNIESFLHALTLGYLLYISSDQE